MFQINLAATKMTAIEFEESKLLFKDEIDIEETKITLEDEDVEFSSQKRINDSSGPITQDLEFQVNILE